MQGISHGPIVSAQHTISKGISPALALYSGVKWVHKDSELEAHASGL